MSLTAFMTATCEHKNNPTGAASTTSVATGIPITPIDPAGQAAQQAYPTEKYFLLKECFTKYEDFEPGDFLITGGVTYAVRAVLPWAEQGGMDAHVHLVLEKSQRSR